MDPVALSFSIGLAALLIGIAIYFGLRQRQTLADLRHDTSLARDDRHYLHRQVVRRLVNSALLCLLGLMLVGGLILDANLKELHPDEPIAEPAVELPENVKESLRLLAGYWIAFMMMFLMMMLLVVFDMIATARYGARKRRQLEDERRATLADEVKQMRRDRHGLNGGL